MESVQSGVHQETNRESFGNNRTIPEEGQVEFLSQGKPHLLSKLPPSAREIFAVFRDGQQHTVQELKRTTGFSIRCTRYAVQRLKERHLIVAKFNFRDARQPLYRIAEMPGSEMSSKGTCAMSS